MLSACAATSNRPDLKRLYAVGSADRGQNPNTDPLILIHGILGSKLRTSDGEDIWPGPFSNNVRCFPAPLYQAARGLPKSYLI